MKYLRQVARAIADDDSNLREIAKEQLQRIEGDIGALRSEADAIRSMLTAVEQASEKPAPPKALPGPFSGLSHANGQKPAVEAGPKLTEGERQVINEVIAEFLRRDPQVAADAVVAEAEARGIRLHNRLHQPRAAIGTMLHFARKRIASEQR